MCNFRQDSACHFSSLVHISLPSGGVQTHYVLVVTVRTAKFTSTQFCVSPYTACMCKARDRYSNRPLFRNTASTDWSSWSVQTVLCEVRTRSLCVIHFSLKLILEGRAGEAWEVSNKWCSFPAPPPIWKWLLLHPCCSFSSFSSHFLVFEIVTSLTLLYPIPERSGSAVCRVPFLSCKLGSDTVCQKLACRLSYVCMCLRHKFE